MAAFGQELSALRKNLRLSQEELAYRAKVNRTYVAKLELGQNQPTLTIMYNLAQALGETLPDVIAKTLQRYETMREIDGR